MVDGTQTRRLGNVWGQRELLEKMAKELPSHIWFVRSNGGQGSYPVKLEGWRVVWIFVAGVAASVILAWLLAMSGPTWLWIVVFVASMAASAWYFLSTARKHTDYSITHNEWTRQ